ncbi:MAG: hypothetical protein QFB87_04545 [Patescibacteria group bacterium]|nr:hypothetical protein [Patescibacteria group bacterium]
MAQIRTGQIGTNGDAFGTWTPTITASTGAFTAVSAAGRYQQLGKITFFTVDITVTTVGTATGTIFSLPTTHRSGIGFIASGREDGSTGAMLQSKLQSTTTASVTNVTNNLTPANGHVYRIAGFYEVA